MDGGSAGFVRFLTAASFLNVVADKRRAHAYVFALVAGDVGLYVEAALLVFLDYYSRPKTHPAHKWRGHQHRRLFGTAANEINHGGRYMVPRAPRRLAPLACCFTAYALSLPFGGEGYRGHREHHFRDRGGQLGHPPQP